MPPSRFGRKRSPLLAVLPPVFPLPDRGVGVQLCGGLDLVVFGLLEPGVLWVPAILLSGFQVKFTVRVAVPSSSDPRQ